MAIAGVVSYDEDGTLRRVVTVTTFERHGPFVVNPPPSTLDHDGNPVDPTLDPDDDGPEEWHWHTQTMNGEVVGDGGEGYNKLSDAVHGFLAQQGIGATDAADLSDPYSKLEKVNENVYQIRKFASETPEDVDPSEMQDEETE